MITRYIGTRNSDDRHGDAIPDAGHRLDYLVAKSLAQL